MTRTFQHKTTGETVVVCAATDFGAWSQLATRDVDCNDYRLLP